jgi:hypothetical protein
MNFGSKDDFSELILKRKDGAVYTIALTGLEGHSISIGREGNRTVLRIELRADMSHVRYQGVFGQSRVEQLPANSETMVATGFGWRRQVLPAPVRDRFDLPKTERLLGPGDAPPSTEKT